jgi:hypothetical protein
MEKKISHSHLIQTPYHSVHSLVAVPTMLPQLLGEKHVRMSEIRMHYANKMHVWNKINILDSF